MKKVLIAAPLEYELTRVRRVLRTEKFPFEIKTLSLGVGPKKSAKTLESFFDKGLLGLARMSANGIGPL